ncbi:MAG: hypothetical protein AAFY60_13540, partial [Myxococcota bacterium]
MATIACGLGYGCSSDADVGAPVDRSECPSENWIESFGVFPTELTAGSDQVITVRWLVDARVEPPLEATLRASLGDTEMVVSLPLESSGAGFDTVELEASTVNPFGTALAGETVVVELSAGVPRGCPEGFSVGTGLPLRLP